MFIDGDGDDDNDDDNDNDVIFEFLCSCDFSVIRHFSIRLETGDDRPK